MRLMVKNKPKVKDEEIILESVIEATLTLLKNMKTNTTKIKKLKSELSNSGRISEEKME